MKEFVTAAKQDDTEPDEFDITFMHDGQEVTFHKPGTAQYALMLAWRSQMRSNRSQEKDMEAIGMFIQFFLGLASKETQDYFSGRILDTNDPLSDLDAQGGVQEIFEYLTAEWSGKDTKKPAASRQSRRASGSGSTGSSRAKGSTSSRSRSTASSR